MRHPDQEPNTDIEAERRRIADLIERDVLDPLKLLLAQALIYEQTFAAMPEARMVASILASLARQAAAQARDLQTSLKPTILESLGLRAALEALAVQILRSQGLQIYLEVDPKLPDSLRLSSQMELALYRLIESAVDQASRMAGATQVALSLQSLGDHVILVYADNAPTSIVTDPVQAAFARVKALGGRVTRHASGSFQIDLVMESPLTAQEHKVLTHLADGLSNKQIASAMEISPRTVNFHLDNIYSKLGVNSRTEAVIYAMKNNLLRSDPR